MKRIIVTEQQLSYLVNGKHIPFINEGGYDEYKSIERMYYTAYRFKDHDMAMDAIKKVAAIKMPNTVVTDSWGDPLVVYHFTESDRFNVFDHEHGSGKNGTVLGKRFYFTSSSEDEYGQKGIKRNRMSFFINLTNPYDASKPLPEDMIKDDGLMSELFGKKWKDNPYIQEKLHSKRGLVDLEGCFKEEFVSRLGYDGIVYGGGWFDNAQYAVNSPSQIKSAEPFTFDDSGNLIPLDQRFDFSKDDIRY